VVENFETRMSLSRVSQEVAFIYMIGEYLS